MKTVRFRTPSVVITAAVGGLVLLYAFLVFMPTSRAIAAMRTALEEKRQFIVATQQAYTEIGALQQDLETTKAWVAQWKSNSPKRSNLGSFFGRLGEISRDSGVRIARITPGDPVELESLSRHPIRLVVDGTFSQLFAFFQAVEQMPYTVWIDRLQLEPTRQAGENLACESILTVFTDNQGSSD